MINLFCTAIIYLRFITELSVVNEPMLCSRVLLHRKSMNVSDERFMDKVLCQARILKTESLYRILAYRTLITVDSLWKLWPMITQAAQRPQAT